MSVNLAVGTATGQGNDVISGVENLAGSIHADVLVGDEAPNAVNGNLGDDTIAGAGGDDHLRGIKGNDTINGDAGNDTISALEGDDRVNGGPGDDYLFGSVGAGAFDGGDGADTVDYMSATAAVVVDLTVGTAVGPFTDTLVAVENVRGSGFADTLTGNAGDNVLIGGGGLDELIGGDGNDTLGGGTRADALDGGNGVDTADYSDGFRPALVDLRGGFSEGLGPDTVIAVENVVGSDFADDLRGDAGPNLLLGGDDDDGCAVELTEACEG